MTLPLLRTAFETSAGLPDGLEPVSWLTPFENARLARLTVPKRRREWMLGRFTAKRLVSETAPDVLGRPLSPEAFEVASEDSGAPFVRNVSGERLPICVTVSHARGAAFCALLPVARGEGAIGGDVEWIEPRSSVFVHDFFTPAEVAAWRESPSAERPLFANAIWSAKESVLKALSLGLSVDTRGVEIRLSVEPADWPLQPREKDWRRFDAVCAAGIDNGGIPLSGLWTRRGRFVVTLVARMSALGERTPMPIELTAPPETAAPMDAFVRELREKKAEAAGTEKDADVQHAKGRSTARERIEMLFDADSFSEIDSLVTPRYERYIGGKASRPGDGVITGFGLVHGRSVFAAAQDASVMGGSLGEMHAAKIVKVMQMALKHGCPFIAINDSGGARIQEGVDSLGGYARIFDANCEASGVIPQLSVILGPCAGGAVYSPGLTDFIFMTEKAYMFITGPDVVKAVMHEDVSFDDLGGGLIHSQESGVSHFLARDDRACLEKVRELLTYLPSNNLDDPPYRPPLDDPERRCPELCDIVPADPHRPYDVRRVIAALADDGRFLEVHELWAQNMVVAFARLNGRVVGFVANQPQVLAGTIDIKAAIKAAHFIRICDAYNIPIVTLQDVPGFLPGRDQECGAIIRNGARMIYAYSEATVPKLMVILRKSYGGAYCVMASKGLRGDLLYAWPNAEIAVMGAEGAVNILFRGEIQYAADQVARQRELVQGYEKTFNTPYVAASRGLIDDVIEPQDTRRVLIRGLQVTRGKRERHVPKRHGISPA